MAETGPPEPKVFRRSTGSTVILDDDDDFFASPSKLQKQRLSAATFRSLKEPGSVSLYSEHIVKHPVTEKFVLLVIVLNAAWIGVDIDWNDNPESQIPDIGFKVVENLFCVVFTVELLLRVLAYRNKMHFWTDRRMWRWNVFDLFLVLLMILETWVLALLQSGMSMNQLTLLRMLRMSRLMRISRIFRMVPELGMMVKSMAAAARSVSSALFLEIGLMYVFSCIFTQWAKSHSNPCFEQTDNGECILDEYFGTVAHSLLSLLQILVFDDAFALIRPTIKDSWYMGYLLIVFMCIGSFTILNMLIGIICEIVSTTTMDEKEKILQQRVRETFIMMDTDGSGCVTKEEFNDSARFQLLKLGIDREVVDNAFEIIDQDGTGEIELEEFLDMIFKLTHPPQTQDVLKLHTKMDKVFDALYLAGVCDFRNVTRREERKIQRAQTARMSTMSSVSKDLSNVKDSDPEALFKVRELQMKQRDSQNAVNQARQPMSPTSGATAATPISIVPEESVCGLPQDCMSLNVPQPPPELASPSQRSPKSTTTSPVHSISNQNGHVGSPGNDATSSDSMMQTSTIDPSRSHTQGQPCTAATTTAQEIQKEAAELRQRLLDILGDSVKVDKALELVKRFQSFGNFDPTASSTEGESDAVLLEVEMSTLAGNEGISALPFLKRFLALGPDAGTPGDIDEEVRRLDIDEEV